tara:strand:- start:2 stop:313 length:312 start_codon:yes stop_codon:yes gene_type:complete
MSEQPKPDIMDGCSISFWVIAGLFLLLLVPIGIRSCPNSGETGTADELEKMQRIDKIEESKAEERALRGQLTISLEEAMKRTLEKFENNTRSDKNSTSEGNLK